MTKTYKKIEKVIEREEFVSCTCDRCGKELGEDYGNRGYDRREFTFTTGSTYEGGYTGDKKGWEIEDLCDECVEVLRELLVQNGFKIREIDEVW